MNNFELCGFSTNQTAALAIATQASKQNLDPNILDSQTKCLLSSPQGLEMVRLWPEEEINMKALHGTPPYSSECSFKRKVRAKAFSMPYGLAKSMKTRSFSTSNPCLTFICPRCLEIPIIR